VHGHGELVHGVAGFDHHPQQSIVGREFSLLTAVIELTTSRDFE
jgi:hypothetical protein